MMDMTDMMDFLLKSKKYRVVFYSEVTKKPVISVIPVMDKRS